MVHLLSVHGEFHARVLTARLGSDGIVTEVRPPLGGPYPMMGEVRVYVGEDDLRLAQALLRADADQSVLDDGVTRQAGAATGMFPAVSLRLALALVVTAALLVLALTRAG